MSFDAETVALESIRSLRTVLADIARHDPDLARQTKRAVTSYALNISEARRRAGKDRAHLFRIAGGSVAEVRTAIEVALAWDYTTQERAAPGLAYLDRLMAMSWRLGQPRL